MSDECRNDCLGSPLFPKPLTNRPGLSHINYRIGTYTDFRNALLRALNQAPVLANWTHREADDPGIALLEGASILGDILTFYQEQYANEAYLRIAQWRESVADLVRLLGYRLSPGVGGKATFAFEVKGDQPVTVPKGFPVKAQIEGQEKQTDFESTTEVRCHPHLSRFHLYRPRRPDQTIQRGIHRLEVNSVFVKGDDGKEEETKDIASIQALGLKPGDRIMLIPDTRMFDTNTPSGPQRPPEILIISKVAQVLDRTIIEFEGSLTETRDKTVTAYRIGRTFRHFGHNAPAWITKLDNSESPQVTQTKYLRQIHGAHSISDEDRPYYSSLTEIEMPLDTEVTDLAVGNNFICQGSDNTIPFVVVRKIMGLRSDVQNWGNISGPSTVIKLDYRLIFNDYIQYSYWLYSFVAGLSSYNINISLSFYNIKKIQFH